MEVFHGTTAQAVLLRTTIATAMAIIGGAIGALLTAGASRRLNLLVYAAMGFLLLITVGDILPDAKSLLPWPDFVAAVASGMLLFFLIGKYVYHICPSCALHTFDDAALQRLGQTAILFMVALAIHATMDGLAVVVGDRIDGKPNIGVLLAVSVHKLPEGMALVLLLIGAGYSRMRAFAWTALIELTTELGGLLGIVFLGNVSALWLGVIFAHVGGGFLYLVGSTLNSFRLSAHGHGSLGCDAPTSPAIPPKIARLDDR